MSTVRFIRDSPGAGVHQFGELPQHVGHLVAPLAAADVDHHVHVGPFGQLRAASPSCRSRRGRGWRLCRPWPRGRRCPRCAGRTAGALWAGYLCLIGPAHTHRPFLHHGAAPPRRRRAVFSTATGLCHGEAAALDGRPCVPSMPGGTMILWSTDAGLLHRAQHVAARHLVARLGHGGETPTSSPGPGRAPPRPRGRLLLPAFFTNVLQGTLDAVVDVLDQARAQLHGQGGAGGLHLRAGAQAGGLLIHLDGGGSRPFMVRISPIRRCSPTRTTSAMLASSSPGGHHQRARRP